MAKPNLVELKLESLADLDDGRVSAAYMEEIRRAVADCLDRPGDGNKRTVNLKFEITPVIEERTGDCELVHGEFHIESKVPKRRSKPYGFRVHKNGALSFSKNAPDNPDQHTIFDGKDGDDD